MKPTTQRVVYIPESAGREKMVETEKEPFRVWVLPTHTDEANPPTLPMQPHHLHNAYLESHVHDWRWENGKLYYFSPWWREGKVWLLLEYL